MISKVMGMVLLNFCHFYLQCLLHCYLAGSVQVTLASHQWDKLHIFALQYFNTSCSTWLQKCQEWNHMKPEFHLQLSMHFLKDSNISTCTSMFQPFLSKLNQWSDSSSQGLSWTWYETIPSCKESMHIPIQGNENITETDLVK